MQVECRGSRFAALDNSYGYCAAERRRELEVIVFVEMEREEEASLRDKLDEEVEKRTLQCGETFQGLHEVA